MKIIHGDGRDWTDEAAGRALTSHYAAPSERSYWEGLEQRIMARIRSEVDRAWWSHFPGWIRMGIAAAAVAAFAAGAFSWQTRVAQERIALKELLGTPSDIPLLTESVDTLPRSEREKTLRYLITH
ncbi:MAG: hypothetical protein ACT4OZ_06945 [Gemmatimonadota bacterium]